MRILLATDGSEYSAAAVDEVAHRYFPADSEVRVISVFEPPMATTIPYDAGVDMRIYDGLEKAAKDMARDALARAVGKLGGGDESRELNLTTEVLSGSPQRVIVEEAERWQADLIVVGSHGYGFWNRALLGSVSQSVALHAHCSVEIVRSHESHHSKTVSQPLST